MNTSDRGGTAPDATHAPSIAAEVARLANQIFADFPRASLLGSDAGTPDITAANSAAAGVGSGSPGAAVAPIPGATAPGSWVPFVGPTPFSAPPAPLTQPFDFGPSAFPPGASGASSSLTLPPVPGPASALPVASAPPPKEPDLRNLPALFSGTLGFSTPISIVQASSPTEETGNRPYFIEDLAGHDKPYVGGNPTGAAATGAAAQPSRAVAQPTRTVAQPAGAVPQPVGAVPQPAGAVTQPASYPANEFVGFNVRPEVVPDRGSSPGLFDPYSIKRDFPILNERVHGRPLIWFDNAATTQKPRAVINRLSYFYEHENSNIHRAAHALAARATDAYEAARDKVRRFVGAASAQEIIFTRGATEAINLVAQSWGRRNVGPGDQIVVTWLEHHANIVPWQQLCAEKGARLCVAPVDDRGQIILEEYEKLLNPRTRLVSLTQVSNALGTILPAKEMVAMAHRHGARVLVDGAQAVSHMRVDVQALDCDFYCFSGHKVFAPTGIGALFGKTEVLDDMPPWQGGGNMIRDVTFEKTTYQPPAMRFEAGTGNIADAVGLGAALDYVTTLGIENITRYEHELLTYATAALTRVPGLRLIGTAAEKAGVLSFVLDGMRTEDVGGALDREGIAVRSGHHCAQPILRRFGLESTVRASLAPYNTCEDVDALVAALLRLQSGRPPAPAAK
jgi:cysteine desulfurase/selenocysteine lyase